MDIHQLTAFLVVAEELHFGRAAQRLHLAQPPLSRMIKQFERELGCELFDRTTRSVRLTSAGEALVQPARQVLEDCSAARRAVQSAGRGETGRVRIGFAGPSSYLMVGKLARAVRERHPGIELNLRSTTYAYESLRSVLAGELDIAFARWTMAPAGLSSRIVAKEHYVLVVPEGHRLSGRRTVSLADCHEEPFVALPADPGSSVRDAFLKFSHEAGFVPRIVQIVPDTWTALALVAAGVGLTFAIDTAVANVVQDGVVAIPLKEGRRASYSRLVWREDTTSSAVLEVLRASLAVLPTPELPKGIH